MALLVGQRLAVRDARAYLADGFGADEPDIAEACVRHMAKVVDRESRTAQGVEDAATKSKRPQLFFPRPGPDGGLSGLGRHPVGVYA